ncbi:hypothetical protein GS429_11430 [Natronorubrum sp. JWXQ-INN-674]|uniref:DUF5658 domain-containing protein n=1 Tax=Natronorubrum halalkaliphilum TaxID=2691917 RepID=A0A6B0VN95_9EURY|nr:hypothetical protein [Natronorubrum halalkaliphilum]MXV62665.1 hypothetical protein [Natronorubrum halalkaliphilum]
MAVESVLENKLDPPGTVRLRVAFLLLWGIDVIAATLFFLVPYATELNPVTVFFYGLFGLPGVALAATGYALIVVAIGHVLPEPLDSRFVAVVVLMYVLFAANNIPLLLYAESLPELLATHGYL